MKTVVLDGYGLNPGDLSWKGLTAIGSCEVHDRTTRDLILSRSQGAQALLTNKTALNGETIRALPDLRYIGVLATGYNIIDLNAAHERGIVVTNVPAYSTPSTAQAAVALLLELANATGLHSTGVRNGAWTRAKDFCFFEQSPVELDGLTLGLIGYGNIAHRVATVAQALGMKIIAHTRTPRQVEGVTFRTLDEVFGEADAISLHCPLTDETRELVNADRLARMKPTAWLINTARGGLIDETALAEGLNTGKIAGAGLDVLTREPPLAGNPLLSARNCIITPHIAWATHAARKRLLDMAVANLGAFVAGRPVNVVV